MGFFRLPSTVFSYKPGNSNDQNSIDNNKSDRHDCRSVYNDREERLPGQKVKEVSSVVNRILPE